jgi:hypothetical protein
VETHRKPALENTPVSVEEEEEEKKNWPNFFLIVPVHT